MMAPAHNCFKDVSENCEMLLFWGADLETTPWGFSGQFPSQVCYWWSEVGIKQVYICPDLNYAAAVHADKWIPVLPNTDAALQLAIAYVWMTEGTYDKKYVATHTIGYDMFEDYVLGKEDGGQVIGDGIAGHHGFGPVFAVPPVHEPGNEPYYCFPGGVSVNSFVIANNSAPRCFRDPCNLFENGFGLEPIMQRSIADNKPIKKTNPFSVLDSSPVV